MINMKPVRNWGFVPELDSEGVFLKPLDTPKDDGWRQKPFERMHAHHTLASARRYCYFKPFPGLIPEDDLDFILAAQYSHSTEFFPDPIDVFLQRETVGKGTWRRLKNTSDPRARAEARDKVLIGSNWKKVPFKYNYAHPVIISGVVERIHPSSVKLMNSSHHSPQSNAGYSRQDSDGNVYQY